MSKSFEFFSLLEVNDIDLNYNGQIDAGSGMKNRTSGISSATRIKNIRPGRGLIEQRWPGFGRRRDETKRSMTKRNSSA